MSIKFSQEDNTALFRKAWTLYDTISEKNYMFHREIYAHVAELLRESHTSGAYHILDLGCGNARFLAPCLQAAPPASYRGVDLSAVALEEARGYLKNVSGAVLEQKEMLQAVQATSSSFDIIFSGFAVHHLDSTAKQQLFDLCAQRLSPGGRFIMVDVVREENQSREQYLSDYLGTMRLHWKEVRPMDLEEACSHVAGYDFPETLSDLAHMAAAAGLKHSRLVGRYAQHHLVVFSASNLSVAKCVSD